MRAFHRSVPSAGASSGDQKKLRQLESDLTRTRNDLADTKRKSQKELTRANDRAKDAEKREKEARNRGGGGGGGGVGGLLSGGSGGGRMEIEDGRNRIRNLERELASMRSAQRRADDDRARERQNHEHENQGRVL